MKARATCSICGGEHGLLDMQIAFAKPDAFLAVPADQRADRCWIDSDVSPDLCVVDDASFFIRCLLPIPIARRKHPFAWGTWIEVDRLHFGRYVELFFDPAQGSEPPFEGFIANHIPGYAQETLGLTVRVQLKTEKLRPIVTVLDGHQLALDQGRGVNDEWVFAALHGSELPTATPA